jgi:hypothetical protein
VGQTAKYPPASLLRSKAVLVVVQVGQPPLGAPTSLHHQQAGA